jgi:hypothetical protein
MEERRSASGLFVLPASLSEEHPLVVAPEMEPEPEPTLEEATGTLLDHMSVRCGREVCRWGLLQPTQLRQQIQLQLHRIAPAS